MQAMEVVRVLELRGVLGGADDTGDAEETEDAVAAGDTGSAGGIVGCCGGIA